MQSIKDNDPRIQELRQFLVNTIPLQVQYLIHRLETVLPQILELVPNQERSAIQQNIEQLMTTPTGTYALVDYVNFKGDGIPEYKHCLEQRALAKEQGTTNCLLYEDENVYACGWGLLQVLREMLQAPKNLNVTEKFSWAAGEILKRRVAFAPEKRKANDERWLPGWLKRTNTYKGI